MATDPQTDVFAAMAAMSPTQAFEGWTQMMGLGSTPSAGPTSLGAGALDPSAAVIGGLEMWRAGTRSSTWRSR